MFQKTISSPIGHIQIIASPHALKSVLFIEEAEKRLVDNSLPTNEICDETVIQLEAYFRGERKTFNLPLDPSGTAFQQQVWQALLKIPYGTSTSYSSIANDMNNPLSVRAVGLANGKNPISIIIPCHRVIGVDGSLTGYAGGLWRKEALLKLEGHSKYSQSTLW